MIHIVEIFAALNVERRTKLATALNEIDIITYPAAANYLLLRLPEGQEAQTIWARLIREHRIVLRDCANYEALQPGHLRTAIRTS